MPEQGHQVALVTGSTRGIGRYSAELLASHGNAVALCSRSTEEARQVAAELETEHRVPTYGARLDVSEPDAARSFVDDVEREIGPVSVLVNNAGVLGPVGTIDEIDLADWAYTLRVNLLGVATMIAGVVPSMRRRGGGQIVNLAGGGVGGPMVATRVSAYTSAKAAVMMLTETIAAELGPSSIQVNAIAPGAVDTGFNDPVLAAGPERAGSELYEQTLGQRGQRDLDRFGALLLHLTQAGAGGLTGRTLSARWNDVKTLAEVSPHLAGSSLYRLRRIDGELFTEVASG